MFGIGGCGSSSGNRFVMFVDAVNTVHRARERTEKYQTKHATVRGVLRSINGGEGGCDILFPLMKKNENI